MNELDIKAPEGYEIDQENSDLSTGVIRFKEVKQGLVKSWEELDPFYGYYVHSGRSEIMYHECELGAKEWNRNIWATAEQAEASIAMAMLSQLMKQANGDWTPDWLEDKEDKYTIVVIDDSLVEDFARWSNRFLAFKSEEIRDEFLELHRDLIKKAKPLL